MRLLMRSAATLVAIALLGCTESTVPKGQIVQFLMQVDEAYIPTMVDAGNGATIRVVEGRLAEGSSGTCDFQIRFFGGNSFSAINGTVPDCRLKAGQNVTVKIDMTTQIGVGEHLYVFG